MGVQRGVNPLAGRCARKGRALPEKQSGQQSVSGRTPFITCLGLTDISSSRTSTNSIINRGPIKNSGNYFSDRPKLRISPSRFRQSSLTFTQHFRFTLIWKKSSSSIRAAVEAFLSIAPPLPMTIPLWDSFSQ